MKFSVLCCLALSVVAAHGHYHSTGLYARHSYRGLPFAGGNGYLPPIRRNPYALFGRTMGHEAERPFNPVAEAVLRMEMGIGSSMRHRDHILKQTRTQSALMAEQYLANFKEDEQCFHRSYCQASITEEHNTGKAAKEAIKVMERILDTTAADGSQRAELPHVQQLVAAYNVGDMTKNTQLCQWLFPCGNKEGEKTNTAREARFVTCKHISRLCPGVSLSCGLCAVLSPESCSVVCPVGAIYCGTSGYSCLLESLKPEDEDDKATEETEAIDDTEEEEAETRSTDEEEPAQPAQPGKSIAKVTQTEGEELEARSTDKEPIQPAMPAMSVTKETQTMKEETKETQAKEEETKEE